MEIAPAHIQAASAVSYSEGHSYGSSVVPAPAEEPQVLACLSDHAADILSLAALFYAGN